MPQLIALLNISIVTLQNQKKIFNKIQIILNNTILKYTISQHHLEFNRHVALSDANWRNVPQLSTTWVLRGAIRNK